MRGGKAAVVVGLALLAGGCGGAKSPQRVLEEQVGPPSEIDRPVPPAVTARGKEAVAQYEAGRDVVAQSGCLACHRIGENGNSGPGPDLTDVGGRLSAAAIRRTLVNPVAPMPSFAGLDDSRPERFRALVAFVAAQR